MRTGKGARHGAYDVKYCGTSARSNTYNVTGTTAITLMTYLIVDSLRM